MNKKQKWILLFLMVVLMITFIGVTYAVFFKTLSGNKKYILRYSDLELQFDESKTNGSIVLEDMIPMSDEDGKLNPTYKFSLLNLGKKDIYYTIYIIEDTKNKKTPSEEIRYHYTRDAKNIDITRNITEQQDETGNYYLERDIIPGNTTYHYEFQMWLDYDAGKETMGTEYSIHLEIEGKTEMTLTYNGETPTNYISANEEDVFTFTNFDGRINYTFRMFNVYTYGIKPTDLFEMSFTLEYTDLQIADNQRSFVVFQGEGDGTHWSPPFPGWEQHDLEGSGTLNVRYYLQFSQEVLNKNKQYDIYLREDYFTNGTIKISNVKFKKIYNQEHEFQQIQKKHYGDTIGELPENLTDRSYQFLGWYQEDEGITEDTLVPEVDSVYETKWTPTQHTLTINPNEGSYQGSSTPVTQNITDKSYTFLGTPTKSNSNFDGYTVNGEGSFIDGLQTKDIFVDPDFQQYSRKTDETGNYLNFSYTNQEPLSENSWLNIDFPSYPYESEHTYEIEFKVRINKLKGTLLEFRFSRFLNDYNYNLLSFIRYTENSKKGEWLTARLSRTFIGTIVNDPVIGTDSKNIQPLFEMWTPDLKNQNVVIDFDIKDVVIRDLSADTLVQASEPTFYSKYGDTTLTANWK